MGAKARAEACCAAMAIHEMVAVALGNFDAVAHLGIPALRYTDGPNGIRGPDNVTAFPASLALAATFDEGLAAAYGAAVASEARDTGSNVLLGPAVDIARTPLGGRLPEAMGEDPCLTSRLAVAEVRAIQDSHVIAMVKHFVGDNAETGRTGYATSDGRTPAVNTVVGERALRELYYPPFKAAVQRGRAGSVMGSYNRLNGVYACQNPRILRTLKEDWGWDGFVAPDVKHAVRDLVAAANAGLDRHPVPDADRRPVLASTREHVALATRIATDGMVLLSNRDGLLPLDPERIGSLAVIGTARDDAQWVMAGSPCVRVLPDRRVTPLEGICARAGPGVRVAFAQGSFGDAALPPVPIEALTPPGGEGTGLLGEYWNGETPDGEPALTVVDATVEIPRAPEGLTGEVWSARWTGAITSTVDGPHRFTVLAAGITPAGDRRGPGRRRGARVRPGVRRAAAAGLRGGGPACRPPGRHPAGLLQRHRLAGDRARGRRRQRPAGMAPTGHPHPGGRPAGGGLRCRRGVRQSGRGRGDGPGLARPPGRPGPADRRRRRRQPRHRGRAQHRRPGPDALARPGGGGSAGLAARAAVRRGAGRGPVRRRRPGRPAAGHLPGHAGPGPDHRSRALAGHRRRRPLRRGRPGRLPLVRPAGPGAAVLLRPRPLLRGLHLRRAPPPAGRGDRRGHGLAPGHQRRRSRRRRGRGEPDRAAPPGRPTHRRDPGRRRPRRCEPGTGEINYPAIAAALEELGYRGTVGLEAWASGDSELALERFRFAFTIR